MAEQTLKQPAVYRGRLGKREQARIARYAAYAFLILGSIVMLLPFFWMLSTSLKPERGIFTMPPQWIPNPLIFDNYVNVWQQTDLLRGMLNSAFIAIVTTVGEIFISTLAGFAFARMRFVGRKTFFGLLLLTMMIPGVVTMVPSFILFRYLGWIQTWLPLIVPLLLGSAFAIFLSRQFFVTLPRELEDAAKVDGCNFFQIYWRIFMPNAKPLVATLFVLGFIARWNDFLGPLIYLQGATDLYTVPLMLARLNSAYERQWALLMAGSMIALAPIILVFIFLQRYFIQSVTMTGLKG